jgi:hypothetical protein
MLVSLIQINRDLLFVAWASVIEPSPTVTVSNFDQMPINTDDELPLFHTAEKITSRPAAAAGVARRARADGAPCRHRRLAASRWPRADMAGRSHAGWAR